MIYHTSNKITSSINLWRVDNNTFRILSYDKLTNLMTGSDYTIVNEKLVAAFEDLLADEIEIRPIKIVRKATGEAWDGFHVLIIKEHINPDKIKITDENERSVWQYNHHLFVSESMKNKLEFEFNAKLEFSEGFSHSG
ncbi:hypothetical protein [Flammeovirga sp. OC4]|uniref:hypothetical protein n=1 Tax=Flammeovirga sp. OC4 TaxID=1382345 RepID=UPI0005C635F0|nr:hypothetical protein [Flammeovirga sp. OC4]